MSERKKRKSNFSLADKITIIKELGAGASFSSVAKKWNVADSTITAIKKNEKKSWMQ